MGENRNMRDRAFGNLFGTLVTAPLDAATRIANYNAEIKAELVVISKADEKRARRAAKRANHGR